MAEAVEQRISILAVLRDQVSVAAGRVRASLQGIGDTVTELRGKLAPLTGQAASFVAGFVSFQAIQKGLALAQDQQKTEQQLAGLLGQNNQLLKERQKLALEQSKVSIFSDQDILKAETALRAAGVNSEKIDVAIQAVLRRTAAGRADLDTNIRQIGRSFTGLAGELGEVEPKVRALTRSELQAGKAADILAESYKDAIDSIVNSDVGRIKIANNEVEKQLERIGFVALRIQARVLPRLVQGLDSLVDVLEDPASEKFFKALSLGLEAAARLAPQLIATVVAIKGLQAGIATFSTLATIAKLVFSVLSLIIGAVLSFKALVVVAIVAATAAIGLLIAKLFGVDVSFASLKAKALGFWDGIRNGGASVGGVFEGLKARALDLWANVRKYFAQGLSYIQLVWENIRITAKPWIDFIVAGVELWWRVTRRNFQLARDFIVAAYRYIQDSSSPIVQFIVSQLAVGIRGVRVLFGLAVDFALNGFYRIRAGVKVLWEYITFFGNGMRNGLEIAFRSVMDIALLVLGTITETFEKLFDRIGDKVNEFVGGAAKLAGVFDADLARKIQSVADAFQGISFGESFQQARDENARLLDDAKRRQEAEVERHGQAMLAIKEEQRSGIAGSDAARAAAADRHRQRMAELAAEERRELKKIGVTSAEDAQAAKDKAARDRKIAEETEGYLAARKLIEARETDALKRQAEKAEKGKIEAAFKQRLLTTQEYLAKIEAIERREADIAVETAVAAVKKLQDELDAFDKRRAAGTLAAGETNLLQLKQINEALEQREQAEIRLEEIEVDHAERRFQLEKQERERRERTFFLPVESNQLERELGELDQRLQGVTGRIVARFLQIRDALSGPLSTFFKDIFEGTKSAKEAFADMLKSFAGNIFQFLAEEASKRLLNFITGIALNSIAPGVSGGAGGAGFAAGGLVEGREGHDVIHARLSRREFVQPRSVVEHYGVGVMEAVRRMVIPRSVLRSFAAGAAVATPVGGFAQGGVVSSPIGGGQAYPAEALVVGNEQALDRLLAGGGAAMTRWLRANRDVVNSAVGR